MPPSLRLPHHRTSIKLCWERTVTVGFFRGEPIPVLTRLISPTIDWRISRSTFHSPSLSTASFSTASYHYKKGVPKPRKTTSTSSTNRSPDNKAQANRDADIDPQDFSDLEGKIKDQLDWLRKSLQKLRSGGRLSPETIEGFPVEIKQDPGGREGGRGKKVEKVKLGDLATVLPRGGRVISVMINEEAHLKSIAAAIQSSPYSLIPQLDSQNPSQLNIPVPPPTAESRAQSLAEAKKEFEKAGTALRDARAQWQKWYRKAEKETLVIRDELEKAHKKMEAVVEKGRRSLKDVYDQAVKGMER